MKPIVRRVGGILGTLRAEYRQLHNRYYGTIEHIDGSAQEVCATIVDRLWEGDFYRTSLGHFDFFWMRDFGTVCESLVKLGNVTRVHHTLRWALYHYRRAGAVTTCIDKAGNTFNAPARRSVDALPWLLHCIAVSEYYPSESEKKFLEKQLQKYTRMFLEKDTGNLRRKIRFAEMRDAVFYDRSAYSIALIARMARCVEELKLEGFTFKEKQYRDDLMKNYWNGEYFVADRSTPVFSAECALMPFFLNVIDDRDLADKTVDYITKAKLNAIYPMQYGEEGHAHLFKYRIGMGQRLMPNYTGTSIWTWHGTFYLHVLRKYGRPEYHVQYANFAAMIERHGNYPELLNQDGSWYYAPIYRSDPGMVWAALFLELPKSL
jgi:hypothetical protein